MRKRRHFFQRFATWCAVLAYALIVSGLPLGGFVPMVGPGTAAAKRLAGKDRSTPFPCMDTPLRLRLGPAVLHRLLLPQPGRDACLGPG